MITEGEGCFRLGYLYVEGKGVRQDLNQAKIYHEKACSLNNGSGCAFLGTMYDVIQNYIQAKTYYEKACNLNAGNGCLFLGNFYYEGKGVKQNKTTAKEYFGKACDLELQQGCDEYRKLNEQGVK